MVTIDAAATQTATAAATAHADDSSSIAQCVYPTVNEGGPGSTIWNCGAVLSGPSFLTLGKCPSSLPASFGNVPAITLSQDLCTRSFTLSLSYSAAVYPGNTVTPHGIPDFQAAQTLSVSETPGWCPDKAACSSFTSVPQTIEVPKGVKSATILLWVQGPGNCGTANFSCDYQSSITVQIGAAAPHRSATSLLVNASVPSSVSDEGIAIGKSATVTVKVTAAKGPVSSISLGQGLSPSSDSAVVTEPSGLSGFSLAKGASRSFTFSVKALKADKVTLSLDATGTASSGESLSGSGDVKVTLGQVLVALSGRVLRRVVWCPPQSGWGTPFLFDKTDVCQSDVVPAAGYTVEAKGTTNASVANTTTAEVDAGGLYEMEVPQGTYSVHVLSSSDPIKASQDGSQVEPATRAIEVKADMADLNFDICGNPDDIGERGCVWDEVDGQVIDANGSPFEDLTVFGGGDYTTTNAQGHYALYVVPGEVTLTATTNLEVLKQFRYDISENASVDSSVNSAPTLTMPPKFQINFYRGDEAIDADTMLDNNDLNGIDLEVWALAVPPVGDSAVTFEIHHEGAGGATTCQSSETEKMPVTANAEYRWAGVTWAAPTGKIKNGFCPGTYDASVTGDGVHLTETFQVASEPGNGTAKS